MNYKFFAIWFVFIIIVNSSITLYGQNYTPPPGSPLANHEHPRVFFTDNSLQAIASYISSYEFNKFQSYINSLDNLFSASPSSKTRNYLLFDAEGYSFLSYAVHSGYFNSFSFGHTAAQYSSKAYSHALEIESRVHSGEIFDNHNSSNFTSDDEGGYVNLAAAVVYDWCYNYLTQSEKTALADFLIYQYDNRDSDVYPGDKSKLDNNRLAYAHAGASGALALWGDNLSPSQQSKVQNMMNMIGEIWFDRIWKMGEQIFEKTAGWGEGLPAYVFMSYKGLLWFTAAASPALGQNIFDEYRWIHNIPLYMWFFVFPQKINGEWSDFFVHRSDHGTLGPWTLDEKREIITIVTHHISNADTAGFYKWILEDSDKPISENLLSDERIFWMYRFLWGIKGITNKDFSQVGIKNSYRFGLGDIIMTSGQNNSKATHVQFYTPKYFTFSHAHQDIGAVNIWKYGTLLLDAWNEKSGHDLPKTNSGYAREPVAHNVLALYPQGGSTVYGYDMDTKEESDAYNNPDNQPGGANHIGNLMAMDLNGDKYDYADYDYTRAYKGENFVNYIRRAVIYIHDPNAPNYQDKEYVLVFDDVDVTNSTIRKRWLGQYPYRPEITDGSWNQVSPGFWTANSGSLLEMSNTYSNAHGRIFTKVLEPSNFQLRLRGGSSGGNYYWFVDAEGNDVAERGPFDDWAAFWVGSYRLEIEDQTNSSKSQYLVLMQVGDANTMSSMVPVEKIDTGIFLGALINQDRIAFFNKTRSEVPTINYNFNSNKLVRHIITGLEQGLYYVRVDGNPITGLDTFVDENGVLYFEHQNGGNFSISKSSDTIPPQTPQGLRIEK